MGHWAGVATGTAWLVRARALFYPMVAWTGFSGILVFLGLSGRLIADDYCNASAAVELGVVGAAQNLFATWHAGWSTDILVSASGYLTAHLPAEISYLPFVVTTGILLLIGSRAIAVALGLDGPAMWRTYVPTLAIALLLAMFSVTRSQDLLYQGVLWQAASVAHLWSILLSVALVILVWERRQSKGAATTLGLLAAAAVVSGFNFSETTILACAAVLLGIAWLLAARHATDGSVARVTGARYLGVAAVAIGSFVVMVFAPGTAARRDSFPPPERDLLGKITHLQELTGNLLSDSLGRHGIVLAFVAGVALALGLPSATRAPRRSAQTALVSLGFAAAATGGVVVAAAGQFVSYPASWHALPLVVLWGAASLGFGMTLGDALVSPLHDAGNRIVQQARLGSLTVSSVIVLIAVLQIAWFAGPLLDRAAAWDRGDPAPIAGADDRGTPWVQACSDSLERSLSLSEPRPSSR